MIITKNKGALQIVFEFPTFLPCPSGSYQGLIYKTTKSVARKGNRFFVGPFRGGNKPPVLPGEEKGFSKAKNGELKVAEVVAKN